MNTVAVGSMTKTPPPTPDKCESAVLCAVLDGDKAAVVRVEGRGNFMNSVPLKKFSDRLHSEGNPSQFIFDLTKCETMDSTFMGVLAAISIGQARSGRRKVVVANPNEHVVRLLKTLGLINLLEILDPLRAEEENALRQAESMLAPATPSPVSHKDQISHTLEAHRLLCRLSGENERQFQTVVSLLEKSLKEETKG